MNCIYAIRKEKNFPFIQECEVIKETYNKFFLKNKIKGKSFYVDLSRGKKTILKKRVSDNWERGVVLSLSR